jgi:hemerythrin
MTIKFLIRAADNKYHKPTDSLRVPMAIEWDEAMRTGVDSVDQQHRKLIAMLNELLRLVGGTPQRRDLEALLESLQQYTNYHFGHEEQCMEQHRCPAAMANKEAHVAFVKVLAEFFGRLRSEGPSRSLAIDLEKYLAEWVMQHIIGIDAQLARCVKHVA